MMKIKIIGGGLAGSECAYQLLKRGYGVDLYEMRPNKGTEAHQTANLAELVCSNSLKSNDESTSQGALKSELRMLDSLIIKIAEKNAVPAGGALAVERENFSQDIEKELLAFEKFRLIREECTDINDFTIVASGPLTSQGLSEKVKKLLGQEHLYFYDAVAPIIKYDTIDMDKAFFLGRYGKGGDDYLNCPMDKDEYYYFVEELASAQRVILKDFEKKDIFNACMPLEVMAAKGAESLRFGPFRPVGLVDPRTDKRPFAVLQLRKEDNFNELYNLVGCQTNLKFGEQKRVFGLIPALKDAEFVRMGVMHRNTFINSPEVLCGDFSLKNNHNIYFAGQISGVEGYVESCMSGLLSAINITRKIENKQAIMPNEYTMCGSLMRYISTPIKNFQPMHVSYSLLPPLETKIRDKKERKIAYSERARENMKHYIKKLER